MITFNMINNYYLQHNIIDRDAHLKLNNSPSKYNLFVKCNLLGKKPRPWKLVTQWLRDAHPSVILFYGLLNNNMS